MIFRGDILVSYMWNKNVVASSFNNVVIELFSFLYAKYMISMIHIAYTNY